MASHQTSGREVPATTSAARAMMDGICWPRITKISPLATNWTVSQTTARRIRVVARDCPEVVPRSAKLMVTPAATAARIPEPPIASAPA